MLKNRLARLEQAAGKVTGGPSCPLCGGTPGGVAKASIVTFNGEGSHRVFGPDGHCIECGAVPFKVINFVTPYGGKGRNNGSKPPQ